MFILFYCNREANQKGCGHGNRGVVVLTGGWWHQQGAMEIEEEDGMVLGNRDKVLGMAALENLQQRMSILCNMSQCAIVALLYTSTTITIIS